MGVISLLVLIMIFVLDIVVWLPSTIDLPPNKESKYV